MNATELASARTTADGTPVMPDEALDYLADRYQTLQIRRYTHATFERYLVDPVREEAWADDVRRQRERRWTK